MKLIDTWVSADAGPTDPGSYNLVLFCGSFEERCLALSTMINLTGVEVAVLLTRGSDITGGYANMMEGRLLTSLLGADQIPRLIRVYPDAPILTWHAVTELLQPFRERGRVLIDITTMPRELMGIVIAVIGKSAVFSGRVQFAYVPAKEYDEDHPWDKVWLSSGVKDIRVVLGYEGLSEPGGTHLILLNGFELERANALLSRLEPTSVSISVTDQSGSTHPKFAQVQLSVAGEIARYLAQSPSTVQIFPKSCSQTYESLLEHIRTLEATGIKNFCIAPLNTKPSSLAAFLLATLRREIQVIYAEPQIYNTGHYASPQDGYFEISIS